MRSTIRRISRYAIPATALLCLGGAAAIAAPAMPASSAKASGTVLIRQVQRALDRDGAQIGVDGIDGPKTVRALLNYQSAHHLALSGKIDPATEKSLGVG